MIDSSCLFNAVGTSADVYYCYQIHPEIKCDGQKVKPKCVALCKKTRGPKADGICVRDSQGFICACRYPC
ncbi:hypothetical protein H5410_019471 [Solanum commersonii]|uniref:Uncharacterized protein n=1 Tax=Solanum commersonii TaxID=4109 RepID=A0A9J5ZBA5_SOLCO|nr:hypothetical protein H5410_019471 [Solanum commersonii]